MKREFFLFIAILFFTINAKSQEINVPEPEFINNAICVVDSNKSIKLEKTIPYEKSRRTAGSLILGVNGSKVLKQVKGTQSSVRLENKAHYYFIVRTVGNAFDPSGEIVIIKMTSTQTNRTYELASEDFLGQSKEGDINYIPFDAKKYGESSYLLMVSSKLDPGEYAISLRNASDVLNCFGVD